MIHRNGEDFATRRTRGQTAPLISRWISTKTIEECECLGLISRAKPKYRSMRRCCPLLFQSFIPRLLTTSSSPPSLLPSPSSTPDSLPTRPPISTSATPHLFPSKVLLPNSTLPSTSAIWVQVLVPDQSRSNCSGVGKFLDDEKGLGGKKGKEALVGEVRKKRE